MRDSLDKVINIEQVLSEWKQWQLPFETTSQPNIVQKFEQGLNHDVYLLSFGDDQQVVVKIYNTISKVKPLGLHMWGEYLGIAPKIYYRDENFRYAVIRYVATGTFLEHPINTQRLSYLAHALTTLHEGKNTPFTLQGFDIAAYCDKHINKDNDFFSGIHTSLAPAFKIFTESTIPWEICHHDLNPLNIFIENERALFIDWEYAHFNNPWFDLASVLVYLDLNDEQASHFLSHYRNGWQDQVGSDIYYASKALVFWCDLLWRRDKFTDRTMSGFARRLDKMRSYAQPLGIELPQLPEKLKKRSKQ